MNTRKDIFKNEGFSIVETETPNKLLEFIKENHPQIIRDNEIKLDELKAVLGLPIDEKVNGYGLNFVGRNVARSKYASETKKELKINQKLSKNFDTTQNMVLKGDNLDSLKLLKSHYSGKIKCIYIDPPYNTANDEFVYPDKFDKEEAEILGLADLASDDMERLEFSFSTKKSHNGWLSFMYPRLLLARDLLKEDGVIFISIDDNEQANLKLLCDEIFGEENFVFQIAWRRSDNQPNIGVSAKVKEYILSCAKNYNSLNLGRLPLSENALKEYRYNDDIGQFRRGILLHKTRGRHIYPITTQSGNVLNGPWMVTKEKFNELDSNNMIYWTSGGDEQPYSKIYLKDSKGAIPNDFWEISYGTNQRASLEVESLFDKRIFDFPKPVSLLKNIINLGIVELNDIILDFFAGSGTTGHAVMQLNAEDGGNRKFILCQIDEPIAKDKPAYQFCIDNNLEPVISSITIERLRRAGEKIKAAIEEENKQKKSELNFDTSDTERSRSTDIGFKVFDTIDAPTLVLEDGQIAFHHTDNDTLSRIYNMIFSVGIDNPTETIECVVEDCIYRMGNHYYITNSEKVSDEELSQAIHNGTVFIDGWTASLNSALQHYKEDVKIVF